MMCRHIPPAPGFGMPFRVVVDSLGAIPGCAQVLPPSSER